ncbi:YbhB/YbcL family Raf kinase inhibitor-like protein [Labilithrix luteola]
MTLTSTSFDAGGPIPTRFTCEGQGTSPQLGWTAPPPGTKSLALVVSDPDAPDPRAPQHTWVHWVLYDLPPSMRELPEGAKEPPVGARAGANDFKRTGWDGPCPPVGRHRYVYEIHALDTELPDLRNPTKADLEKAMAGHVLAKGELVGTYQKIGK